jgi:hypothetical protein
MPCQNGSNCNPILNLAMLKKYTTIMKGVIQRPMTLLQFKPNFMCQPHSKLAMQKGKQHQQHYVCVDRDLYA